MAQIVIIFGIVILVAGCLYIGTKLTSQLHYLWFWSMFAFALTIYAVLLWAQVAAWIISDIVVMLVAILVASAIGKTLSSSSALIAFCIAAGVVDFFSFTGGLTSEIMTDYEQGQNLLLQYLSISVPLSAQIVPIIGIGDLVILGGIYYALRQLGHHNWVSFLFPLGGLLIALSVGLHVGGVYALPFIGGATILYLFLKSRE